MPRHILSPPAQAPMEFRRDDWSAMELARYQEPPRQHVVKRYVCAQCRQDLGVCSCFKPLVDANG